MERYPWNKMGETVRSTVAVAILIVITGIIFLIWEVGLELFFALSVALIVCIISLIYKLPFYVPPPYSKE